MLSATKHLGPRVRSFAALRMTNLQDDIMASRNLSLFIEILVNNRMAIAYKTKIGHAHLKVRDLQRSIDFYTRFLGLNVTEVVGNHYAFLTAGTYHNETTLKIAVPDAHGPPPTGTGPYPSLSTVPLSLRSPWP